MALLLTPFIASVNSFLMSFTISITSFKSSSVRHDVHTRNYVPI